MNKGKIVQVIGPVVDIEFADQLPAIYNALTVEFQVLGKTTKLTLEVQQHLGDNWVRAVAEIKIPQDSAPNRNRQLVKNRNTALPRNGTWKMNTPTMIEINMSASPSAK